jgi:predicted MPP superfamily phosphohydrolase
MKLDFYILFMYAPFAVLAAAYLLFVARSGFSRTAKVLWSLWLLACFSKFFCFRKFGGHAFYPEFPQNLIVAWDVAYSGAVIFALLCTVFFFRFRLKSVVLPAVAWTAAAIGVSNGVRVPDVREIDLAFGQLPDSLEGYRIVQLSDLHCSSAARKWRTQAIVDKVNALDADLVCLTGDYADGYVRDRGGDMLPLKQLRARDGVYYVAGNHEFYRDSKEWTGWYRRNGMRFLVNECVFPRPALALGGVNDICAKSRGGAMPDVRQAFAAATNGEFRVLLQHRPAMAEDNIREIGVDLQLSGHTHGGVAPVVRQLVSKHNSGYSRGIYRYGDGILYVSPGAGQWAGFPLRFFNPSEIAVFRLTKGKGGGGGRDR